MRILLIPELGKKNMFQENPDHKKLWSGFSKICILDSQKFYDLRKPASHLQYQAAPNSQQQIVLCPKLTFEA